MTGRSKHSDHGSAAHGPDVGPHWQAERWSVEGPDLQRPQVTGAAATRRYSYQECSFSKSLPKARSFVPVNAGGLRSRTGVWARACADNSPGRQVAGTRGRHSMAAARYGSISAQYLSIV